MPTQFEALNLKLDDILYKLDLIAKKIEILPGDLELDGEVPDGHVVGEVHRDNRSPRTLYQYMDINGRATVANANQLEPKVIEVIQIAQARGDEWSLYETEDGIIRLATSAEAVAIWNAQHPGRDG